MKFYLKDIKKIKIRYFKDKNGFISVISLNEHLNVKLNRIFFVNCDHSTVRGNHAHKKCYQLMFSLMGKIKLIVDDGLKKKEIFLEVSKNAFLIPPTVWASQQYPNTKAILGVICDRDFEEEDYIRNYKDFKKLYKL